MTDERPADNAVAGAEPAQEQDAQEQDELEQDELEQVQDEPERDVVAEAAVPTADLPGEGSGTRRVLAAVFWLLASVAVLAGGLALWAHQTLLTANGWGGVVEDVIADEEVTEAISVVVVDRLSGSLAVQQAVARVLPGPDFVARAVSGVVEDQVAGAVATFAASDAFRDAFVSVNKAAHEAAMRVIRGGESKALTSEGGVISLSIFPLIEGVLYSLQEAGIIDESREIPDLGAYEPSPRAIALIETVLDREIPDDVGTIVLVDSENLEMVQTAVRWFDLITIVLLLAWAGFTALALWLAGRRVRMVLWLSGGAIAALLAGRFLARLLLEAVTRRQPELEARVVVSAIIDAALDSLLWFTFVLIVVAVVVAVAALWWERRGALERPPMETPPRTIGRWVKANVAAVLAVGIGIIGLVALWSVAGAGIAMLTAGAILLLVIAVKVLSDQTDDDEDTASEAGTTSEG